MKSKEELNKIKEEVEAVNEKLAELTGEEIAQVNGGAKEKIHVMGTKIHPFVSDTSLSGATVGSQCN